MGNNWENEEKWMKKEEWEIQLREIEIPEKKEREVRKMEDMTTRYRNTWLNRRKKNGRNDNGKYKYMVKREGGEGEEREIYEKNTRYIKILD